MGYWAACHAGYDTNVDNGTRNAPCQTEPSFMSTASVDTISTSLCMYYKREMFHSALLSSRVQFALILSLRVFAVLSLSLSLVPSPAHHQPTSTSLLAVRPKKLTHPSNPMPSNQAMLSSWQCSTFSDRPVRVWPYTLVPRPTGS